MQPAKQCNSVRFGPFRLDLAAGELHRGDRKIRLQEQPLRVLKLLVERPGEVVTREELKKRLWPNDTIVEFDHSINSAMRRLRDALGDTAEKPKYVETVARRGYRLLVSVEWEDAALGAQPGSADLSLKSAAFAQGKDAELEINSALPSARSLTGKKVSHYRVLEILGGGGMGVVCKAEDIKLGRTVALKFLPEELANDRTALDRFEREARAASALNHPNICTIHEFGEHEGQPFIAMEFLEGQTLREVIARGPSPGPAGHPLPAGEGKPLKDSVSPLPAGEGVRVRGEPMDGRALRIDQLLDVAVQTANGLEAAHQKGITHRDIKPANIFITTREQVKILDFGLAKLSRGMGILPVKMEDPEDAHGQDARATAGETPALQDMPTASALDRHLSKTGVTVGTAGYMSPEQLRGEKVDARTDLFSFGLVLYEMATGQQAFKGETMAVVRDAILNLAPAPVRELNPEVPPKLEEIINKVIEKDRELRYQRAADIRADLKSLKGDTDSSRGRVGLPALDRPTALQPWLMLGAVVLVLAVGGGVTWLLARHRHVQSKLIERQITANSPEAYVTGAAISPDGKYVAYGDHSGLYLRSIDSGETRAVSLPAGFQSRIGTLEWFPDGGKLLAEVIGSEGIDLWVITTFGEAAPQLLFRRGGQPAISPDGRLIAFVSGEYQGELEKAGAVLVGGINGESPRQFVTGAPPERLSSPVWSPDGRWIAYARFSVVPAASYLPGARRLPQPVMWSGAVEVRPAGGGPAKTLVSPASLPPSSSPCNSWANPCLRWSPDWRLLFSVSQAAAASSAQAESSLWGLPVEQRTGEAAGRPEQLAQWGEIPEFSSGSAFGATSPTITADGKRLSFLKGYSWPDVYLGELTPDGTGMKPPRRFTLDKRGNWPSTWTRDSKAIIFVSRRSGKLEILRQGLDESIAEAVAQSPGKDCGTTFLTPNGSWMLYREWTPTPPGAPHSLSWLMRRPVAGGSPERVFEEPVDTMWDLGCPRQRDSFCIFSRHEGKDIVFYKLDPTRGIGDQLGKLEAPPRRLDNWDISPDGSRVALVGGADMYQGRVEVLSFPDRAWHEVPVEPGWGIFQSIAWTADGEGFYVTSVLPGSFGLLHISLTGKVSPLFRNSGLQWMWGPVPSPDGKYLAFQAQTVDRNVWMLENF
jgi:eukaryotic-like serine/threonine-protein kinase